MRYLLDTNFLIGFLRGHEVYIRKLKEIVNSEHFISSITVTEIYAGCHRNEEDKTSEFLSKLVVIPVSAYIAREAGKLVYHYFTRGKKLYNEDAIIAATTKIHRLVLLTQNVKDFPMLYPSQIEKFPN